MSDSDVSGVGLQGAGTAAVFSTTFLWLETLMPVTNAIGAAYTVAWNVAIQVWTGRSQLNLRGHFIPTTTTPPNVTYFCISKGPPSPSEMT